MNLKLTNHKPGSCNGTRICANLLMILVLVFSTSGCAAIDEIKNLFNWGKSTTDHTLRVLDNGIARLDNESADWKSVLQDMQSDLTEEAQSTIRNEITQLMERSVAAVGSEVRCIIDMTHIRIQQDLIRIRANLLDQAVPPPVPYVCTIIPTAVDMARPANDRGIVEMYGFDLTSPGIEVWLVQPGGMIDVSEYLAHPTHYLMTLDLSSGGIPVNAESQKILLKWDHREIYSISILQPSTPVCEIKADEKYTPGAITQLLTPRSGDTIFGDTHIWVYLELRNYGSSITTYYQWYAEETNTDTDKDDPSIAEGNVEAELILPPTGWAIYSINTPLTARFDEFIYDDINDHNINGGGPVELFHLMSTPASDDPGRTIKENLQVDISFNEIRYSLIQTGNCADPNAVVEAAGNSELSVATIERMVVSVPMDYWTMLPPEKFAVIESYFIRKVATATSTPAIGSDFHIAPSSTPASSSIFQIAPSSTPRP